MSYQVLVKRETLSPGEDDDSMKMMPKTFGTEDLALVYTFSFLEGFRRHSKKHDILFQIQGPDGFLMNHPAVMERYRKWYWLKTGRLP